jgi:hypothetical protein
LRNVKNLYQVKEENVDKNQNLQMKLMKKIKKTSFQIHNNKNYHKVSLQKEKKIKSKINQIIIRTKNPALPEKMYQIIKLN